jgi:hypothetical protein
MSPRFRAGRCRVSIRSTPSNSFAPARHARRVEGSNSASGKERQVEEVGELIGLYDKKTGKEFIGWDSRRRRSPFLPLTIVFSRRRVTGIELTVDSGWARLC